jgi:hypothetical protein
MSRATRSFLIGAMVGLLGTFTYLAPLIARERPDFSAIFHRLQGRFIGPAGHRSGTAPVLPKGIHRGLNPDDPFKRYRRA